MKESKIIYRCVVLAGILLVIAALLRAISVNNFVVAISTGDISKHYAASVLINASFSSVLLLLIAVWVFFLSRDLKKLQRRAWLQAIIIGISLAAFGAGFWYQYPSSVHIPLFLALGLLLLVPLFIYRKHFK